ncbi:MAG TPA: nitroreductase family protein [Anaerolineales bacterium]|nr:nitroreductase family protein [Anaerolineales bacterium]
MNQVIDVLMKRRSVRAYEEKEISADVKAEILKATLRAPTAGNLMLYSIVEVTDQKIKDRLAISCDNQPFIARAPMVWLFLADYQRWFDYFVASEVEELCKRKQIPMRKPEEGDLFLACCDALIAAQNAVIAAESFGIGSCYIGDIMEQYETHKELFDLPQYTFPICLLVFGYPTPEQLKRPYTKRFGEKFIFFQNQYHRLDKQELKEMFAKREHQMSKGKSKEGIANYGQAMYLHKFNAEFSVEMSRSVKLILNEWLK